MSFVDGYRRIEAAFDNGQATDCVLKDIFIADQPGLPDPETPFGQHIKKTEDLTATGEFGDIDVTYESYVFRPDPAILEGVFPLEAFNHRDNMTDPALRISQTVTWEGLKGLHEARVWKEAYRGGASAT